MLSKPHRLTSADDYRVVVRKGRKVVGSHTVIYLRVRDSLVANKRDLRFGFIVSKKVGNAVRRNLLRRQMKAICHESLISDDGSLLTGGVDIVVRALPSAKDAGWSKLHVEIQNSLARGLAIK